MSEPAHPSPMVGPREIFDRPHPPADRTTASPALGDALCALWMVDEPEIVSRVEALALMAVAHIEQTRTYRYIVSECLSAMHDQVVEIRRLKARVAALFEERQKRAQVHSQVQWQHQAQTQGKPTARPSQIQAAKDKNNPRDNRTRKGSATVTDTFRGMDKTGTGKATWT